MAKTKPSNQRKDLLEYHRRLKINRYKQTITDFENSPDYKKTHEVLRDYYGIKEPYGSNILRRIFGQSFSVIQKNYKFNQ